MGAAISSTNAQQTRTITIETDDCHTINISDAVINRLRSQNDQQANGAKQPLLRQQPSLIADSSATSSQKASPSTMHQPQSVPDVGTACCCLHAPLNRPTAQLNDVQHKLRPIEIENQRQQIEWQSRQKYARRPADCERLQAQLMQCYRVCDQETLRCSKLANEFNACLRQHHEQLFRKIHNRPPLSVS